MHEYPAVPRLDWAEMLGAKFIAHREQTLKEIKLAVSPRLLGDAARNL
jgi:hypothetical protein